MKFKLLLVNPIVRNKTIIGLKCKAEMGLKSHLSVRNKTIIGLKSIF